MCRSEGNPEGWIPLAVAENKLSNKEVLDKLEAVKDYPTWVMNYAGWVARFTTQKTLLLAGWVARFTTQKTLLLVQWLMVCQRFRVEPTLA